MKRVKENKVIWVLNETVEWSGKSDFLVHNGVFRTGNETRGEKLK